MNTIPIVCIALMGVLLVLLGANVTRHRAIRGATGNQMPTDPADRMFIAQRAHGNATEYIPTLAILIVVCATLTDGWWLNALAIAALARGPCTRSGCSPQDAGRPRTGAGPGAMGTYAAGLALGITALVTVAT